jgi:hypothetical protein
VKSTVTVLAEASETTADNVPQKTAIRSLNLFRKLFIASATRPSAVLGFDVMIATPLRNRNSSAGLSTASGSLY